MDKLLPANEILERLVGYQLRLASGAFLADYVRATGEISVKRIQFALLAVIRENPGIRQGEAGALLGIQRAYLVSLIKDLLNRGLIERKVASDDRRALALRLTEKGNQQLQTGLKLIFEHEDKMLRDFSQEERNTLMRLLKRIPR